MNLSNKLWEPLEERLLDGVFVLGATQRLVKKDEDHLETIGNCVLYWKYRVTESEKECDHCGMVERIETLSGKTVVGKWMRRCALRVGEPSDD
ncbi:hypothetical protein A2U01_0042414 [Trifolium medium]|uniref:Uncharacterized protein n=1 Tax=Trifolium medium TaxID=97028 RepID=A0A392QAU0_9FABA|nr:hypothetical protein [Trifolium medium]